MQSQCMQPADLLLLVRHAGMCVAMTAHKPLAAALVAIPAHQISPAEPSAVADSNVLWQLHTVSLQMP